jgi:hypothetical protein
VFAGSLSVLMAPGIFTWLEEFWEICAPLVRASENIVQLTVNDLYSYGVARRQNCFFLSFFLPSCVMETGDV